MSMDESLIFDSQFCNISKYPCLVFSCPNYVPILGYCDKCSLTINKHLYRGCSFCRRPLYKSSNYNCCLSCCRSFRIWLECIGIPSEVISIPVSWGLPDAPFLEKYEKVDLYSCVEWKGFTYINKEGKLDWFLPVIDNIYSEGITKKNFKEEILKILEIYYIYPMSEIQMPHHK